MAEAKGAMARESGRTARGDGPEAAWGTPAFEEATAGLDPRVREVAALSASLCAVPAVTVPAQETDFVLLARVAALAAGHARSRGLRAYELPVGPHAPYPFLVVTFADLALDALAGSEVAALIGHLDVVPETEPGQFEPSLRGGDLYARGAADMKTVVATFLAWMGARQARTGPRPPVIALLSCCEENGSHAPNHTRAALDWLRREHGVTVRFGLVGERTGELEWMPADMAVGPVCRENRSWRWLRAEAPEGAGGLSALRRIASAVALGRTCVLHLNERQPAEKVARQPGVRSGLVNPFCFVAGDAAGEASAAGVSLRVRRLPGGAIHSAAAGVSRPALVERFADLADAAVERFGGEAVRLAGLEIGQDGNYNSYDGSGELRLRFAEAAGGRAALQGWLASLDLPEDLEASVAEGDAPRARLPTALGIDIRELLDHREAVEALLACLADALWGPDRFEVVLGLPPWRCPETHPDLAALLAAWEAVVGTPSADLVKLHGNDGGSLVAWHHTRGTWAPALGEGPAVVFGQVGRRPHGAGEMHRLASVAPYWEILDRWADSLVGA